MRRERQRLQKEIEQEVLAIEKERKWLEELQEIARFRINPFINLKLGGDALRAIDDGITPRQYFDICESEAYANEPEDLSDDDFFDDDELEAGLYYDDPRDDYCDVDYYEDWYRQVDGFMWGGRWYSGEFGKPEMTNERNR